MKLFVLLATVAVVFFEMASGFVMTPSAFGGSRVVSFNRKRGLPISCQRVLKRVLNVDLDLDLGDKAAPNLVCFSCCM